MVTQEEQNKRLSDELVKMDIVQLSMLSDLASKNYRHCIEVRSKNINYEAVKLRWANIIIAVMYEIDNRYGKCDLSENYESK